ncbi:MAG: hypothetical protein KDI79_00860 [Anaerolineae bacterium]|nr:hypothetical protein [Anaerolineae bacterium]
MSLLLVALGVVVGVISASLLGISVYFTSVSAGNDERSAVTIRQLAPLEAETTAEPDRAAVSNEAEPKAIVAITPTGEAVAPTETAEILSLSSAGSAGEADTEPIAPSPADSEVTEAAVIQSAKATPTTPLETAVLTKTDVLTGLMKQEAATKTDVIAIATATSAPTATPTAEPEAELEYVEPYTSTDQVQPPPSADPTDTPIVTAATCPTDSSSSYELIPIEGRPLKDHPAYVHGDLNLALRGYVPTNAPLGLTSYEGATDGDAPQLHGLFEPNRVPQFTNVYRINDWIWDSSQCGGHPRGCPGPPADTFWPVTLVGVATTPGEPIYLPERGGQIYSGGYSALVLYAEEKRITLGYTRRDTVAAGYVVHLENVCVNPNLVALYKAQEDADGWLASGHLPGLRNNQSLGTAFSYEIQVAIRDAGTFMDPRSQKDWWR